MEEFSDPTAQLKHAAGLDQALVKRTIKCVKKQRDDVAHGRSISRQDVVEYREDWLNPSTGIFAALMRSGL
jgi:hypothetical protein